jgi:peptide/nickel transport system permease protein
VCFSEQHCLLPRIELKQPIDPLAELKQNPQITPQALAKETARLALDKPFWMQYGSWLNGVLHGDLGNTIKGESVLWLFMQGAKATILVNLLALGIAWFLAIPSGLYSAAAPHSVWAKALQSLASTLMSIPSFISALFMAIFLVKTHLLPYGGFMTPTLMQAAWYVQSWDVLCHALPPALVLVGITWPSLFQQMYSNTTSVLNQPYIRMSKSRGMPQHWLLWKHVARNALNPLVTLLGMEFAGLLSGALLTETILNYPGLGMLTFQASMSGDTNLVMTSLMIACFLLLCGNFLADLALLWLDPRLRTS